MHTELFTTQWYIKSHYQWQILYNENLFLHHKACCEARTQNSCLDILYTHVSVCSVEKCCIFYAPFLSHLFVFKIHTSVSRLFHKISFDFKSPSKIDSSHFDFHTQTTFPIRDPISTLQSGRKIFLFWVYCYRYETQDTDVYVTLLTSKRQTKLTPILYLQVGMAPLRLFCLVSLW